MIRVPNTTSLNLSSTTGFDSTTNTPSISTSNGSVTTSNRFTATFTAPNTTNKSTGVLIYFATAPTTGAITVTLQDNSVDTSATATLNSTDISGNGWAYFRFATPYTFASTAAGRYRFKIVGSASTGGTIALDSGLSLTAFIATDDRTGAVASTDDVYLAAHNATTAVTLTVDGTSGVVGSGTDTSTLAASAGRSVGLGMCVNKGATLQWDTGASATLQLKGHLIVTNGGAWNMGTVASPYPPGKLAHLQFNQNGTSANYGFRIEDGGKSDLQGQPKSSITLWKTKYVSGAGTAASPLVTADAVDWAVGDEIVISATSNNATNYSETESRFIITKNSSTSFVVSTSKGGAEAAFTNTHSTDAWVLNVERNVLIDTTNTAQGFYGQNGSTVAGNVNWKWARFETIGTSLTSKSGIYIYFAGSVQINCDYCVVYRTLHRGFFAQTSKVAQTHTGLVTVFQTTANTGVGGIVTSSANSKTFIDCFVLGGTRAGFEVGTGAGYVYTRCYAIGCNTSGATPTAGGGGFYFSNNAGATLTNCEAHACRSQAVQLNGATGVEFDNCLFGTKGQNQTTDIYAFSDTLATTLFSSCSFGSATLIANYLGTVDGSEIAFHRYQQTDNRHRWYNNYGMAKSTGAGLTDTTVRTPNSLAVGILPEDATTGFAWRFNIPAKAHSIVNFFGYFGANTALATDSGASARVELWLPGSSSADATSAIQLIDISGGASWKALVLSAQNTADTDGLAEIRVYALSVTSGATLYVDDLYNAGDTVTSSDKVTGLDTWYKGKPLTIIQPSATSAADIWTFPTANLTTAGTTGSQLRKGLTKAYWEGNR